MLRFLRSLSVPIQVFWLVAFAAFHLDCVSLCCPQPFLADRQGWGENGMWGNLYHFSSPPTFVVLIHFARSELPHTV